MGKRRTKSYWEEEAKRARRQARTAREKLKAYKEGFKDGLKHGRGDL